MVSPGLGVGAGGNSPKPWVWRSKDLQAETIQPFPACHTPFKTRTPSRLRPSWPTSMPNRGKIGPLRGDPILTDGRDAIAKGGEPGPGAAPTNIIKNGEKQKRLATEIQGNRQDHWRHVPRSLPGRINPGRIKPGRRISDEFCMTPAYDTV